MSQSFLFNEIKSKQNGDEIHSPVVITYEWNEDFNSQMGSLCSLI